MHIPPRRERSELRSTIDRIFCVVSNGGVVDKAHACGCCGRGARAAETMRAAELPTTEWVEDFVGRWFAAWNSHDVERVLELMTDDIVYVDGSFIQWPEGTQQ